MPVSCAPIQSAPAVATSARIARTSGIPAAASEPNATASTASVTGQESTSERSIAALFSSLNSDHSAAEPVSDTSMPGPAAASSCSRRRLAARTMSAVSAAAPPLHDGHSAVGRSTAGRATAPLRLRGRAAAGPPHAPTVARKAGLVLSCVRELTTADERIAALAVEVPIDQTAGLHGLRAIGLPAAAGQRVLGARSEYAEANRDHDPGEHDLAAVGGRPAAEPAKRAD